MAHESLQQPSNPELITRVPDFVAPEGQDIQTGPEYFYPPDVQQSSLSGEEARDWGSRHGLPDGRFFVGRSSGEVDYGGWSISSVDYGDDGNPAFITVERPSPSGEQIMAKVVPAVDLLKGQVTPSGKTNLKALDTAARIETGKGFLDSINNPAPSEKKTLSENMSYIGQEILDHGEFEPRLRIQAGGRSFGVSRPTAGGRMAAVLWSEVNGKIVPRFAYKSNSAGDWRVAYRVSPTGRLSKEANRESGGEEHYTQENKLHDELAAALDYLSGEAVPDEGGKNYEFLCRSFLETRAQANEVDTAEQEVSFDEQASKLLRPFSEKISAGELSDKHAAKIVKEYGSISSYFKSLDKEFDRLPGFVPNFNSNPADTKTLDHPLLGKYTLESFQASLAGRPIVWTMGRDSDGRSWIDGIKFQDLRPSSYGTGDVIINSGVLTSKPIDYVEQTDSLADGAERKSLANSAGYADISPVLENLLPIRQYKKALAMRSQSKKGGF